MKFVIVKMIRETRPAELAKGAQVRYPDGYDALEVHVSVRGPHVYDGGILMYQGETEELLLRLPDEMVDRWTRDNPDFFRELSQTEAESWVKNNRKVQSQPAETVSETGAHRILLALARATVALAKAQGVEVSGDDLNALDPNHPEPGAMRPKKDLAEMFETVETEKTARAPAKG